ncbi:hypothetical protein ZOSMA_43G00090 [Zostera marina]|uniref:LIM zinc-binding domain-containing protein n=1 Tax=Zostera marina TaxID=29655 RepID=A0A0K9P1H2_ZOSMR|nr:hypothetical protein ZOSMA_43G00090 [Zostera marina]
MSFTGTLDKCKACDKTVYVVDFLSIDGIPYHKACFRCSHCNGTLAMSNYSSLDGILYCKPHFEQHFKETGTFTKSHIRSKSGDSDSLFKEKGSYNHLLRMNSLKKKEDKESTPVEEEMKEEEVKEEEESS